MGKQMLHDESKTFEFRKMMLDTNKVSQTRDHDSLGFSQ